MNRTDLENELEPVVNRVLQSAVDRQLVKRFTPGYDAGTKDYKPSGFDSFGEYLSAVQKADKGRGEDTRLKALSEGTPSAGGFLVPIEYKAQLLAQGLEDSFFRKYATIIPMSTEEVHLPRIVDTTHASTVFGGCKAYWKGEAAALTESEPAFGSISLIAKKLTGYTLISNELLADAQPAAEVILSKLFGSTLAWYEEEAFINGLGAGQPLGILRSGALITVSAVGGQGANTILAENIFEMYSRLLPSSTKRAIWICSPDIKPQLYTMGLAVGAAGSIVYMPMGGLSAAPYDTLMGLPVVFSEHCPKLGTVGDIILADLSYYLIGDRTNGLRMDASMHVKFAEDQTAFRFTQRVDGMPWVDSPITPSNGGATLSPLICLNSTRT